MTQKINVTTIRLEKEETLIGEVFYYVYVNDSIAKAILVSASDPQKSFEEATTVYNNLIGRLAAGYPKREIIYSYNSSKDEGSIE